VQPAHECRTVRLAHALHPAFNSTTLVFIDRYNWLMNFILCNNKEGLDQTGSFATATKCLKVGGGGRGGNLIVCVCLCAGGGGVLALACFLVRIQACLYQHLEAGADRQLCYTTKCLKMMHHGNLRALWGRGDAWLCMVMHRECATTRRTDRQAVLHSHTMPEGEAPWVLCVCCRRGGGGAGLCMFYRVHTYIYRLEQTGIFATVT
jgi:hypothetical protein